MPLSPRAADRLTILFLVLLPGIFFWRETLGWLTLGDADAVFWFFPAYKLVAEQVRSGHWPLWNPYLYSGLPLFAEWEPGVLDPLNWIHLLGASSRTLTASQEASFSLSLLGVFAYARSLGLQRRAGVVSAVIYALSGFAVARTIYPGFLHVLALTPLVLWFIERLYQRGGWRDMAGGAGVVAWQILAGHPQPVVYSSLLAGAYVIFCVWLRGSEVEDNSGGIDSPHGRALGGAARWRFLGQCAGMFVGGTALSAVQLMPAWEFATKSVRQRVPYEFFTWHSLHPVTLLTMLFPFFHGQGRGVYHLGYWGPYWHHNEGQFYLGVLALSLAAGGAVYVVGRRLRVGMFWAAVGIIGLLLSLGKYAGPVAWALYRVPLVGSFRSPNRHWMEVTLAVGVLAGYAVDYCLRAEARPVARAAQVAGGVLAFLGWVVGGLALSRGDLAEKMVRALPDLGGLPQGFLRPAKAEFYLPMISALVLLSVLVAFARSRRRHRWYLALLTLLVLDYHLYGVCAPVSNQAGLERLVGQAMPAELAARQSEHEPLRYHLWLPPASGGFNPFWFYGAEMATGYDPLALERYKSFSGIDEAGRSYLGSMLEAQDRTLDLLNVRYLLVPSDLPTLAPEGGGRVEYGGIAFANDPAAVVDLRAGQRATYSASEGGGDTLAIVSTLADAGELADGEEVAEVTIGCASGWRWVTALRAGRDTSEWAYDRPDVRREVRHARAPVAENWPGDGAGNFQGHAYLARLQLPPGLARCTAPRFVKVFAPIHQRARLSLRGLAFYDASSGRSTPLARTFEAGLQDDTRWRRLPLEPSVPGYQRLRVYENLRALPRAWLVGRVEALPAGEQLRRIRGEALDDRGQAFDPRAVALVEPTDAGRLRQAGLFISEASPKAIEEGRGDAAVKITARRPASISIEVEARRPALLVLAEIALPGWRLKLDGAEADWCRVDYLLRGVPLAPGRHRLEFFYRPHSLLVGAGVSALAALCLALMIFKGRG